MQNTCAHWVGTIQKKLFKCKALDEQCYEWQSELEKLTLKNSKLESFLFSYRLSLLLYRRIYTNPFRLSDLEWHKVAKLAMLTFWEELLQPLLLLLVLSQNFWVRSSDSERYHDTPQLIKRFLSQTYTFELWMASIKWRQITSTRTYTWKPIWFLLKIGYSTQWVPSPFITLLLF